MTGVEVLIGLMTGMLVGASAIGSGSLVTPLLLLWTAVPAPVAIGTSLALATGTKLSGYIAHRHLGHVDFKLGTWLLAGAIPGTIAAVFVLVPLKATLLPSDGGRQIVGLLLMVLAALLFWTPQRQAGSGGDAAVEEQAAPEPSRVIGKRGSLVGALVSFIVTLTSVGSGGLLMLALMLWQPKSGRRYTPGSLVGTVTFYGLVVTVLGAGAHVALNHVDFVLLAGLLAGSVPGVLLGARFTRLIPERYYQKGIAGLNLALGLRLALIG